jgi:hypothetical protein
VLNDVNVDTAPKRFVQPFPLSTPDNLADGEVWCFGMIAME